MPVVSLLLRLLARVALFGLLARAAGRRAAPAYRTPGQQPAGARPVSPVSGDRLRSAARQAGDWARLVGRIVALCAFLAAFGVLLAAGTTLTSLGPRWVGITLLSLGAIALVAAAAEFRLVWRMRMDLFRRRRAARIRAGESPPAG